MPEIRIAAATRKGTDRNNADRWAQFTSSTGQTAVCVVDMIGHAKTAPKTGTLMAETAVRIGVQRGALAGLLAAGALVADDGAGPESVPDGVAVLAVIHPGRHTRLTWVGDCEALEWNGRRLRTLTDPHTIGVFLRRNGDKTRARLHNNWIRTSLALATPTSVAEAETKAPSGTRVLLLMSDGITDQVKRRTIKHLTKRYATHPKKLAKKLVAAAENRPSGRRDDATVIVVTGTSD
ncbi:hypothetical protein GCM10010232_66180 [Streptomyces amakusaensis]|uniref:PP2C family serine/threonine-protein phosphatase n=1 Tax=Streptomyces amakusaensis TaxID=67271 RepID=A0ABW0ARR2_9ACTN